MTVETGPTPEPEPTPQPEPADAGEGRKGSGGGGSASSFVAAGILLSRVVGLVRDRVFAQYFGTSLYADVFRAGLRMPNVLQNLLGEGTLSASFIPVYSELLEQGKREEAGRVAGAIFALLVAIAGTLSLIGVLAAPLLVSVLLPGFEGERRELAIIVTRIIFPMTGLLVLSAWALGILNSHRRFFLSYVSPVVWNGAMIATLILFGGRFDLNRLVIALAWGAMLGGALQFLVQIPVVLKLERELKVRWNLKLEPVREAIRNAGPAILGRGVVQLSGYVDVVLASLLATGALARIGYAQTLYILPVSLFGMSVAAAELPELARRRMGATEELRLRTNAGLQRIAFYIVPSFVAFLLLGDTIVAALYQTGRFERDSTIVVYLTLAGFSLGLLASTATRLFSSTFFALRDTRTPARFAIIRVLSAAVIGSVLMVQFEPIPMLGIPAGIFGGVRVAGQPLGAVGLAIGSGIAAWIEWGFLRRALRKRIGHVGASADRVGRMFAAALAAGAAGWAVRWFMVPLHPVLAAIPVLGAFGLVYFVVAYMLGLGEVRGIVTRLQRFRGRS